jgi:hypothetical protein
MAVLEVWQLMIVSSKFLSNKRKELRPGSSREQPKKREFEPLNQADELFYCTANLWMVSKQDNIGSIWIYHGRTTFLDIRNQITREKESILLPKTGAVKEQDIMLWEVLETTNGFCWFDHECAQNPLTVIIQDCTILHDIYSNLAWIDNNQLL